MDWLRQMLGLPAASPGSSRTPPRPPRSWRSSPRASGRPATPRASAAWPVAPALTVYTSTRGALVGGQGGQARRLRARSPAPGSRSTPRSRCDPMRWSAPSPPTARRAHAGLRRGHGRHDVVHRHRPAARHRRDLPARTASGCTWTPPTPAPPRSCPSCARLRRRGAGRQLRLQSRTSGCWSTSTAPRTSCATRDALLRTFQASPEYLRTAHDPEVVNYRDWGIQLGRRFRALKLWFVIRSYGVEGLRAMMREHIALARELAAWIESATRTSS